MPNPNTNCLAMMMCPDCGSYGPFIINATVRFLVNDEGTERQVGDTEWIGASACECNSCGHRGTVDSFTQVVLPAYQEVAQ